MYQSIFQSIKNFESIKSSNSIDLIGPISQIDYESCPIQKFTFNCGESITSLAATSSLILASTFPGSVFVLEQKGLNQSEKVRMGQRRESLSQVQALQETIRDLEGRLEGEKARYFELTQTETKNGPNVSALPIFNSSDSFLLQEGKLQQHAPVFIRLHRNTKLYRLRLHRNTKLYRLRLHRNTKLYRLRLHRNTKLYRLRLHRKH